MKSLFKSILFLSVMFYFHSYGIIGGIVDAFTGGGRSQEPQHDNSGQIMALIAQIGAQQQQTIRERGY
jgi:hypothetical protein